MQHILETLKDITGFVRRVADEDANLRGRKDLNNQLDAMAKRVEELSEKHQTLMKAVDEISKEANHKKRTEEDKETNGNP
jgi:methyl-accepting chemotaxis protein